LVVGVPSWYLVKSMMNSRRLAGHSSKESRLSGNGQQPAVVGDLGELHALLGVLDAVLALQLVTAVAQGDRRLRALRGGSSA
jgi:hypothetical protein